MSIPISASVSASQSTSQQPVGFLESATYYDFGAGTIAAPQENNLTPTSTPNSTATSSAATGATASTPATAATPQSYELTIMAIVVAAVALGVAAFAVGHASK